MLAESPEERVRREDLHLFVNAGLTATGQGGYYHGAEHERLSLAFLHRYIAMNYRRLYALCLAAGLNDHNLGHCVFTLLKLGAPSEPEERAQENRLLTAALQRLPPQRAYKLFERLARKGVNNRRTRALVRGYLSSRRDLAFDAIKYRRRLRRATLHAHLTLPKEVAHFLFKGARAKRYDNPLLETYRRACHDSSAIFQLPFSVAQGLAERKGIDRATFMKRIEPMMTEREKLRAQSSDAGDFDPDRLELVELCVYYLQCPPETREDLLPRLRVKARKEAESLDLGPQLRVATVLDRSRSSSGHREARERPLAVSLAIHLVLEARCPSYRAHWTSPIEDLLELHPRGDTDLARPLLDALGNHPQLVIVVSDGRENAPRGGCEAIAKAVGTRFSGRPPTLLHINPVFNPDDFTPLSLGPSWPTIGVARVGDLSTALAFARYHEGGHAEELSRYLERRARDFVHDHATV